MQLLGYREASRYGRLREEWKRNGARRVEEQQKAGKEASRAGIMRRPTHVGRGQVCLR
jgi:hypothetical protein